MKFIRQFKIEKRMNAMYIAIAIVPILILSIYTFYQSKSSIWDLKEQYLELTHQLVTERITSEIDNIHSYVGTCIYASSLSDFWEAALDEEISNRQVELNYETSVLTVFGQQAYINAVTVYIPTCDKLIALDIYYGYARDAFELDKEVYDNADSYHGRIYYHVDDEGQLIGTKKIYYFDSGIPRAIGYMSFYIDESIFSSIEDLDFIGNVEVFFEDQMVYAYNEELDFDEGESFYIEEFITGTSLLVRTSVLEAVINEEVLSKSYNLFFLGICLFLVSLFVNQFISRTITRPIKILEVAMKKVAEGDFDVYVSDIGQDEVAKLVGDFNLMTNQIKTLIHENYVMELQEKEYRLKYLRMQINPHFLYNTLDAIRFKALNHGNDDLGKDIELLSDMFRRMVDEKREITLGQEIVYIEEYIYFQKQIYKDKIRVVFDIEEELMNSKVMKFLLQPLVENAIYHGMDIHKEYLEINISARKLESHLIKIQVRDNGKGCADNILDLNSSEEMHIGIKNILQRIKAKYGEKGDMLIESEVEKGTKVTIIIVAS